MIGGQVVAGINGAAGEIGYNLRSVADVGLALDRRAAARAHGQRPGAGRAGRRRARRGGEQLTAADVFAAAAADRRLDGLIDDFVDELAFHLVNLAILVNPAADRGRRRHGPLLGADQAAAAGCAAAGTPFPPELVVAHFPHDAPLLGAVAMAVDAARGRADAAGPAGHDGRAQDRADGGRAASQPGRHPAGHHQHRHAVMTRHLGAIPADGDSVGRPIHSPAHPADQKWPVPGAPNTPRRASNETP